MAKWRNRKCESCCEVLWTASKSETCLTCQKQQKKSKDIIAEADQIKKWGYTILEGPMIDKFNHRTYKIQTPCQHEWTLPFINLIKQVKNAQSKGLRSACGVCGPQHRFQGALQKYIEKYGRDYDLAIYNEYMRLVRKLSENVNKSILNPDNLSRGRNHGYHLDHKVPIIECFKRGMKPEDAADIENLQLLPWADNLSKGSAVFVNDL